MIHAGIMKGELEISATINLDMPDSDCFHFAEGDGLIETMVDLGDRVTKGQPIARVWPVDRTGVTPSTIRALRSGLLTSRHFPGLVKAGDCIAVIAVTG